MYICVYVYMYICISATWASQPVMSVPFTDLQSRIRWLTEGSAAVATLIARKLNSCKRRVFAKLKLASMRKTTHFGVIAASG